MNTRVNPFSDMEEPPVFSTKPKPEKPVEKASIARIAEENNFPSRQPPKAARSARRAPRKHTTGRNVQFGTKVTAETDVRIDEIAKKRGVVLGELIKQGLDALEALEPLEKIAMRRGMSWRDVVNEAAKALERS